MNTDYIVINNALISQKHIKKAEMILADNGIDPDDVCVVLQAIGYALLDVELYEEMR